MRRPFLSIVIFFGLGISMGWFISFPFGYGLGIGLLLFMAAILFYSKRKVSDALLYGTFIFAGFISVRSPLILPQEDIAHVAKYYYKAAVVLKGVVASDVRKGNFFLTKKFL